MRRKPDGWKVSAGIALVALVALVSGCADDAEPAVDAAGTRDRPLQVRTTCFPVDWLVQRIAGDRVERVNILPKGADPPFWQPSGEVIADLGSADLIIINGAGFERWTLTAALPVTKLVDSAEGLDLMVIGETTHSHGVQGEHSHAGTDPHTWSDPLLFLSQAGNVHTGLVKADPRNREHFDRNLEALKADLEQLDREYARVLASVRGLPLAANHPAYNYLARRYGLDVESHDLDAGEIPSEKVVNELSQSAPADEPWILLWEARPAPEMTAVFPPELRHIYLDPLEQPGDDGTYDYLAQARANLRTLESTFAP